MGRIDSKTLLGAVALVFVGGCGGEDPAASGSATTGGAGGAGGSGESSGCFVQVDVSDPDACVVRRDGRVFCWKVDAPGVAEVTVLGSAVEEIAASARCARTSGGEVGCVVGGGAPVSGSGGGNPAGITTLLDDAIQLSADPTREIGCAVRSDHTLWCWGNNGYGTLGQGGPGPGSETPVEVALSSADVQQVSASIYDHVCALTTAGAVWCWGANEYGQLGTGAPGETSYSPAPVPGIPSAGQAVAVDVQQTCAVVADRAWCWGTNYKGGLGDGSTTDSASPVAVQLDVDVRQVDPGYGNACAVDGAGGLWCWGNNMLGQLGDGTAMDRPLPVGVAFADGTSFTGATQVSTFNQATCALRGDDTVWCWGRGQPSPTPIDVPCPPAE